VKWVENLMTQVYLEVNGPSWADNLLIQVYLGVGVLDDSGVP